MKGRVIALHGTRCAVVTVHGIAVLDVLGQYRIGLDDLFAGALDKLGRACLTNLTTNESVEVRVEALESDPKQATGLLTEAPGNLSAAIAPVADNG